MDCKLYPKQHHHGHLHKQPHCRATTAPFTDHTRHPWQASSCRTWARVSRTSEIPTGRKPYLASVQQIIWDRTNLCHHCILRTQDNAKLTERFSINFSTDRRWRPHSRVLKLFICSVVITAANPYWRSILTQRLCSTFYCHQPHGHHPAG